MAPTKFCTYILSNKNRTVFYVGVTSNLQQRYLQHLDSTFKGFTSRYNCHDLVYFESSDSMMDAIVREKTLKKLSRANKIRLITSINSDLHNLAEDWKLTYENWKATHHNRQ